MTATKFSMAELEAAFRKVADPTNWKRGIKAKVAAEDLAVTIAAITWFAGSVSKVSPVFGSIRTAAETGAAAISGYEIEAAGYYADVGA